MRNIEDRIGGLERDLRRVRIVLLLLLVVAAGLLLAVVLPHGRAEAVKVFAATALLLAGAETAVYVWRRGQGVPDIVRAKKFEVVDERGHIFVEIGETTDGRGAVVTHDGDMHVILMPAHPPIVERKESDSSAQARGAPTEPVLKPAEATVEENDSGAAGGAAGPGASPRNDVDPRAGASSRNDVDPRTPTLNTPNTPNTAPQVDVELSYRGDGVYEAKITERDDAPGGDARKRPDGKP